MLTFIDSEQTAMHSSNQEAFEVTAIPLSAFCYMPVFTIVHETFTLQLLFSSISAHHLYFAALLVLENSLLSANVT